MRHALPRYLAVGAVATLVHGAVLVLAVEASGLPPWLASGLGAVVGAQVAFAGNGRYTFTGPRRGVAAWWRFMGTAAAGAVAGMGLVSAGVALGLHYLVAQALATATVVLATFVLNWRWSVGG